MKKTFITGLSLLSMSWVGSAFALPQGFVYLSDIDPSIMQDMRYAGYHNFIGRPIKGYQTGTCILTQVAAQQLKLVQTQLSKQGLSLKVYDCYRPQMAVEDFYNWSRDPKQRQMKAEFYPRTEKSELFDLGYIARQSGHSRGSTMDLTIVAKNAPAQAIYKPGQALVACYAPYNQRYRDNSIDMGSGFDCLDPIATVSYSGVSKQAHTHRKLLHDIMVKNGFDPYYKEWWHFTLKNEPYPNTAFNFEVK